MSKKFKTLGHKYMLGSYSIIFVLLLVCCISTHLGGSSGSSAMKSVNVSCMGIALILAVPVFFYFVFKKRVINEVEGPKYNELIEKFKKCRNTTLLLGIYFGICTSISFPFASNLSNGYSYASLPLQLMFSFVSSFYLKKLEKKLLT